jgi:hypothetical protein
VVKHDPIADIVAGAAEEGGVHQPRAVRAQLGDEGIAEQATATVSRTVEGGVEGPGGRREPVGGEASDIQMARSIDGRAVDLIVTWGSEIGRIDDARTGAVELGDVAVLLALVGPGSGPTRGRLGESVPHVT